MAHYSRLSKIVIDVPPPEHDRELAFWSGAAGQPLAQFDRHPEYHGATLPGQGLGLLIQRLGQGPGRVHLDIHTDDLAAEMTRLQELGAERVQRVHSWWIMRDPAGLLFCVIPEPAGSLNDSNAQRWDGEPVTDSVGSGLTRSFGWSDMFVRPEDDPRTDSGSGDERTTLVGYLRAYRMTIELKCSGLDATGMARRSVAPSNLSLLGLVRHLADVEHHWFRRVLDGQDTRWLYRRDDDRDAAFNGAVADPGVVASAWATWRAEVSFAEHFVEEAPSLEVSGTVGEGDVVSLREVLVHMIEEYARHAGHADLLRERIDGRVGQ